MPRKTSRLASAEKSHTVIVRVSDEERRMVTVMMKASGETASTVVRQAIRSAYRVLGKT